MEKPPCFAIVVPNCSNQSVNQVDFSVVNFSKKPKFDEFVYPMIPQAKVNNKRTINNITNIPQNSNLLCQNFIESKFESLSTPNLDFNQKDNLHKILQSEEIFDFPNDVKHQNINEIKQRKFELEKLSDNLELLKSENLRLLGKKDALNKENSEIQIQFERRKTDMIYFDTQLYEIRIMFSDVALVISKFHYVAKQFRMMENFVGNDLIDLKSRFQNDIYDRENDTNLELRTYSDDLKITTLKIDELNCNNSKLRLENDLFKSQFTNFKIDYESRVEQFLEMNENIKQVNFELNEKITNLNFKIEEFMKTSQSLENDNEKLSQEIYRLIDVSERKEESELFTKSFKVKLGELQNNILEFENIISELKIKLIEEESKTIESNEKLANLNRDLHQNLKLETEVNVNIEQLSSKIEELEVNKSNLMETIDNLESKIAGFNLTNLDVRTDVENLRNIFIDIKTDKDKYSKTIENLHNELINFKERNCILTDELNCLKENNELSIPIFEIRNLNLTKEAKKHYFDCQYLKNKLNILSNETPKQLQSEKIKLENCINYVNNQIKIVEQKTDDYQV